MTILVVAAFAPNLSILSNDRDFVDWIDRRSIAEGSWPEKMMAKKAQTASRNRFNQQNVTLHLDDVNEKCRQRRSGSDGGMKIVLYLQVV